MQSKFANWYLLENEICPTWKGDKTIQEYYNIMSNFWDQLALMEPKEFCSLWKSLLETSWRSTSCPASYGIVWWLWVSLWILSHRSPLPSVSEAVNELLVEEIHLKTSLPSMQPMLSVLAATHILNLSPLATTFSKIAGDERAFCHDGGHWKNFFKDLLPIPYHGSQQMNHS